MVDSHRTPLRGEGGPAITAVIRDDDISYFTDPERFQVAHAFLIRNRVPFTIAAIPEASDSALAASGAFEGFIPGRLAGQGRSYPIGENTGLVRLLASDPLIEIAQHGFSHAGPAPGAPEFSIEDAVEIAHRLDRGILCLEKAFGSKPGFFVPPRDRVSRTALAEIRKRFSGICLSRFPHGLVPMRLWPAFLGVKHGGKAVLHWGRFRMVQHPGMDFTDSEGSDATGQDPVSRAAAMRDVLVLPLHSWRFFDAKGKLNARMLGHWEDFLKSLAERPMSRFVRLSETG
jgi:peptidoglycan/xylan/chitin deacetylase (PgdA/CDA1 family)